MGWGSAPGTIPSKMELASLFAVLLSVTAVQDRRIATLPEEAEPASVSFSHDGSRVVYDIRLPDGFQAVSGDWRSAPSLMPTLAAFSRTGEILHVRCTDNRATEVRLQDRILFEFTLAREQSWSIPGVLSADGKVLANLFRDTRVEHSVIVLNGKSGKRHPGIASLPALSPDGVVVAFALEHDDGHCVVVNDVRQPDYDWVTSPVIGNDGRTVAYGAESGKDKLLVLGERKFPIPDVPEGVFITPDGSTAGYWKKFKGDDGRKRMQVVALGREGPVFAEVRPPIFSSDGFHVSYRAKADDGRWRVVVDGTAGEPCDVVTDPAFIDGKVGFGIRKGRDLFWRTVPVR